LVFCPALAVVLHIAGKNSARMIPAAVRKVTIMNSESTASAAREGGKRYRVR
jgi:hypothetical protein